MELLHSRLLNELNRILDQSFTEDTLAPLQLLQHEVMSFVCFHIILFWILLIRVFRLKVSFVNILDKIGQGIESLLLLLERKIRELGIVNRLLLLLDLFSVLGLFFEGKNFLFFFEFFNQLFRSQGIGKEFVGLFLFHIPTGHFQSEYFEF